MLLVSRCFLALFFAKLQGKHLYKFFFAAILEWSLLLCIYLSSHFHRISSLTILKTLYSPTMDLADPHLLGRLASTTFLMPLAYGAIIYSILIITPLNNQVMPRSLSQLIIPSGLQNPIAPLMVFPRLLSGTCLINSICVTSFYNSICIDVGHEYVCCSVLFTQLSCTFKGLSSKL